MRCVLIFVALAVLGACEPAQETRPPDERVVIEAPRLPEGVVWVGGSDDAPGTKLVSMGPQWEIEVEVTKVPAAGSIDIVAPKGEGFEVLTSFGLRKDRAGLYRLRFEKAAVPAGLGEVFVVVRTDKAIAVGQALIE